MLAVAQAQGLGGVGAICSPQRLQLPTCYWTIQPTSLHGWR